jgi:hypothetical protein
VIWRACGHGVREKILRRNAEDFFIGAHSTPCAFQTRPLKKYRFKNQFFDSVSEIFLVGHFRPRYRLQNRDFSIFCSFYCAILEVRTFSAVSKKYLTVPTPVRYFFRGRRPRGTAFPLPLFSMRVTFLLWH